MRLLVFGASGACGSWVVQEGLKRGHSVTAVVRASSTYDPPDGIERMVGEVTDPAFVRSAVDRRPDAILSCLGLRRAGPAPWSKLLSPPDLVQTFTRHLLAALPDTRIRKVVWISAGGVGDSRAKASAPIRALIRAGNVGVAYRDLEHAEALVPAEDSRWLAVRPVTLMNGPATGRAEPVGRYGLFSIVRRADLAAWMVDVTDGTKDFDGRTVLLGTPLR